MVSAATKVLLPQFTLTRASEEMVSGATHVSLSTAAGIGMYYAVPIFDATTGRRHDGRPVWTPGQAYRFPVVLCGDGAPWPEANLWLMDRWDAGPSPNMQTLANLADDLAAFRRYIEDEGIDWLHFPAHRLKRPTYRYKGHLRTEIYSGNVSSSVANRRISAVVRFYRWVMSEGRYCLANPPWVAGEQILAVKDVHGFSRALKVKTTDMSIKTAKADDPWTDYIVDDGRLRPLPQVEQAALLAALAECGSTEMKLLHLLALFTGARIQTALTIRVRHVARGPDDFAGALIPLKAGPGTGIDTKHDKRGLLQLPKWLYEELHVYVRSDRAVRRRLKAQGGDHADQFLFLSHMGNFFYEPKDLSHLSQSTGRPTRHIRSGQAVRQFIKEYLLPEMRRRLDQPQLQFSFHDLRATFGMNVADSMTQLIERGEITYTQALDRVRQLMWHASPAITERYLRYRVRQNAVSRAEDGWSMHLMTLGRHALQTSGDSNAAD